MAKNTEPVVETESTKKPFMSRTNLAVAGIAAGAVLALGGTFAAGVAVGHSDRPNFGDGFAAGPQHGGFDNNFGGHGQHGPNGDNDGPGMQGGFTAPQQGGQMGGLGGSTPMPDTDTDTTTP